MYPDNNVLPLISIIMPAHNCERFIHLAIRSVLEQTYKNLELIIIDDASTDDTADIIKSFPDPRIRYQKMDRIGLPSGVRNVGLEICRGEFIGFLDADDELRPDGIELLYRTLSENPQWIAAEGFSFHINEQSEILEGELISESPGQYKIPDSFLPWSVEAILTLRTMNALPSFLMRREALKYNGLFNDSLLAAEDFEYKIRLYLNGLEIGRIPEYIYYYRVYSSSVTKSANRYLQILESNLHVLDWFICQLDKPESYKHLIYFGYGQRYYNAVREQLNAGNAESALHILNLAWQDFRLPYSLWFRMLMPLYMRCRIPQQINQFFVDVKRQIRHNFSKNSPLQKIQTLVKLS